MMAIFASVHSSSLLSSVVDMWRTSTVRYHLARYAANETYFASAEVYGKVSRHPLPDSAESNLPGEAGVEFRSPRGRAAHGLMLAVSTGWLVFRAFAYVRKDIDR
jgi:hypothetical protein